MNEYKENYFVPHEMGKCFIAEIPKAYYAEGDDLSVYKGMHINLRIKDSGYRSVHYVISYENTYIELQTRTIYDEAWSDCDHSYVYKHEANRSHAALQGLSDVLCESTNASNDLGDVMHMIYSSESIVDLAEGLYSCSDSEVISQIDRIILRYDDALNKLKKFRMNMNEGVGNGENS